MKKFISIFVLTLILVWTFLFLGGYLVFGFHRHYYSAGAACAFIIALIIYAFAVQFEKIESLEKRIEMLEQNKQK